MYVLCIVYVKIQIGQTVGNYGHSSGILMYIMYIRYISFMRYVFIMDSYLEFYPGADPVNELCILMMYYVHARYIMSCT